LIQVELSAAEISIEPGGTAQLTVTVINRQPHDDHVFWEIEGIDVEWYALPVPAINVAAGESQQARVLFRIPRSSECQAGTYPFLVCAKGMESGATGVQQACLTIKPFSSLQIELYPKRAASTFLRHNTLVEVKVSNLGNREETLGLHASDPEDGCTYEFETERVRLKPGHTETVSLLIEPVKRPLLGTSRLYGYTVTARSTQDSYVSASTQGQLEHRPLLSTLTAILLLLIVLGGGGYALFRPVPPPPPVIHSFTASPERVMAGEAVTLSWDVSNPGTRSVIQPGNLPVRTSLGSVVVRPEASTTYVLIARNGGEERRKAIIVNVTPRPTPPAPKIAEFRASQTRIHLGDSVTLSWKVQGAQEVYLNPLGRKDDPRVWVSQEVKPEQTTVYILTAKNPGSDKVAVKQVKVEVVPLNVSLAQINYFRAKPDTITSGEKSTLAWSVSNAVNIEIDNGIGADLMPQGKIEVQPSVTTTYTLKATDNKGNITTQSITITVKPPEPPADTTEPIPLDSLPQAGPGR